MVETAIIGIGMTPVGEHWGQSLREIAAEAGQQALADAGVNQIDALYVGNAYGSTFNNQTALGALIADFMGLSGVEAYTTEAGEASGGAALRTAHMAVASGLVNTALVIGVEKPTDIVGSSRTRAQTVSLDADYESIHGATLPALAALLMRRYMHEYGVELQQFEGFSVNAHANGQYNSHAMFQRALREGSFARAPMVADPVSLFDGAPDGDGAAAVVITAADRAADMIPQPIRITGSSVATDAFMLQERRDMLYLRAVEQSVTQALSQAGISRDGVDLFELHDAFTILSALTLEAAGYAERGTGWQLAGNGAITRDGIVPISTFGGLKSRGNPAGATGVYQAVEACLQLRHEADENQIAGATHAMIQNLGGCGHTAITHILSR